MMRMLLIILLLGSVSLVVLGAIGDAPRYLEELRIGGGYGEAADGGADLEADGTFKTDGRIRAGSSAAGDTSVDVLADADNDTFFNLLEGDESHGGVIWYEGAASALHLGTRDGTAAAIDALSVERGSPDVKCHGDLFVDGYLQEGLDARGVSTSGLLALWRFEDDSSFLDWTGYGHDMNVSGTGTSEAEGKFGTALSFDGDGYAATGTFIPSQFGASSLSVTAWAKTSCTGAPQTVAGWNTAARRLELYVTASGYPAFEVIGTAGSTAAVADRAIADGSWHNLCAVRDYGDQVTLYVDGLLAAATADTAGSASDTASLHIAARANPLGDYFDGLIDEAAVWGRPLTAGEAKALARQRGELAPAWGDRLFDGTVTVQGDLLVTGGGMAAGNHNLERGVVTAWDGAGGTEPGCLTLVSPNGTAWHLFAEDDGTIKVHSGLPSGNSDGAAVGAQY